MGSRNIDIVRGGPGNDMVFGGTSDVLDGGSDSVVDTKYLYGDEGHDSIWGSTDLNFQYIFGGSGNDEITSGDSPINSIIHGNDGDDIIRPGKNGRRHRDGV